MWELLARIDKRSGYRSAIWMCVCFNFGVSVVTRPEIENIVPACTIWARECHNDCSIFLQHNAVVLVSASCESLRAVMMDFNHTTGLAGRVIQVQVIVGQRYVHKRMTVSWYVYGELEIEVSIGVIPEIVSWTPRLFKRSVLSNHDDPKPTELLWFKDRKIPHMYNQTRSRLPFWRRE